MKHEKFIISGMGGAIAILFLTALAFISCGMASVTTIYVPDNYAKIQWAVDNATTDDTIIVRDGTYHENVDVNKRLTIYSENGSVNCIVNAANTGDHVFAVTANYVNISGFTIADSDEFQKAGIYIDSAGHCNVSDNIVSNNNFGIYLTSSSYNVLQNNNVSNNPIGIYLENSSSNIVTNNTANMSEQASIFMHSSCCNNQLTNNTALHGGTGIYLMENSSYNTITNNTASGNVDGICLFLSSCNNNLTGNIVNVNTGILGGIYISWASNGNKITRNNVSDNSQYGIYLESSSDNLIYNNYFNNTNNSFDDGTNIWNTTTITGPNIVGGPFIGGNYWSDYTGIDNNCNGFGDTAYNVPGGTNKDHLPLAPMCGDLDCNCIVNIMDVRLLLNHVNNPDGYPVYSWAADVDGEGGIDTDDVQRLLTHVFDPVGDPLTCS